jgi:macrolide transport system ATP-binding/permease protein
MNAQVFPSAAASKADRIEPMIRVRGLIRRYGLGDAQTAVLKGIDLDIAAGEFVAIIGQSGSGKSTLMNILGCLDRPSEGTVQIAGQQVDGLSQDDLASLRRDRFGFIFQRYHLVAGMSAAQNVELPAVYAGIDGKRRRQRAETILERLGLGERLDHAPDALSGGQQQRVSIARALMNDPDIILADEPTGALDSDTGESVMALLAELNAEGKTVIIVTHDPDIAAQAGRVIRVRDGLIVDDRTSLAAAGHLTQEVTATSQPRRPGKLRPAEIAAMALSALRRNRMRTALTMLGIVIGVASVVAMLAIGAGAREQVLADIRKMGTDLIEVKRGARNVRGGGDDVQTLTASDLRAIGQVPGVAGVIPESDQSVVLRSSLRDHQVTAIGTSHAFPLVRDWAVDRGIFFDETHEARSASVAVIGSYTADLLYPGSDPVGEYVLVNNAPFQIIGVMEEKGVVTGGGRHNRDDQILIPYTTAGARIFGQDFFKEMIVKAEPSASLAALEARLFDTLLQSHGREDFHFQNMSGAIEQAEAAQASFTVLLGSIAAISLLVGGIGVMNIMLVSVTERIGEIGIRMAIGARRIDITRQFLVEAVAVCAAGGLTGAAIGVAVSIGLPLIDDGFAAILTPGPVIIAVLCAVATGLLFGIAPARKAAALDPVAALTRN